MYARLARKDEPQNALQSAPSSSPNRRAHASSVSFVDSNKDGVTTQATTNAQTSPPHIVPSTTKAQTYREAFRNSQSYVDENDDVGFEMPAYMQTPQVSPEQFFNMPPGDQLGYLQRRFTTIRTQRDTAPDRQYHMKGSNATKILDMLEEDSLHSGVNINGGRGALTPSILQDHFNELEANKALVEAQQRLEREKREKEERLRIGLSRGAAKYMVTQPGPLRSAIVAEAQLGAVAPQQGLVVNANTLLFHSESAAQQESTIKIKALRRVFSGAKLKAVSGLPPTGSKQDGTTAATIQKHTLRLAARIEQRAAGNRAEIVRSFGRSLSADRITFRTQTECQGHLQDYNELLEEHKEVLAILNGVAPSLRERQLEETIKQLTLQNKNQLALIKGLREKLNLVKKSPKLASLVLGINLSGVSLIPPAKSKQIPISESALPASDISGEGLSTSPPSLSPLSDNPLAASPFSVNDVSLSTMIKPNVPVLTTMVVAVSSLQYLHAVSPTITAASVKVFRHAAFGAIIPDFVSAPSNISGPPNGGKGGLGISRVRRTSLNSTTQPNGASQLETSPKRSILEICRGEVVAMTCTPQSERYQLLFEHPTDAVLFGNLFHYLLTVQPWHSSLKDFPETATQLVSSSNHATSQSSSTLNGSSSVEQHPGSTSRRPSLTSNGPLGMGSGNKASHSTIQHSTNAPPSYIWNGLRASAGIEVGCGLSIEPLVAEGSSASSHHPWTSSNVSSNFEDGSLGFAPTYRKLVDGPAVEVAATLAELAAGGETLVTSAVIKYLSPEAITDVAQRAFSIVNRYFGVHVGPSPSTVVPSLPVRNLRRTSLLSSPRPHNAHSVETSSPTSGNAGERTGTGQPRHAQSHSGQPLIESSSLSTSGSAALGGSRSPRGVDSSSRRAPNSGGATLLRPVIEFSNELPPAISFDALRVLYSSWGTIKPAGDSAIGQQNGDGGQVCAASAPTASILLNRPSTNRPIGVCSVFTEQLKFRSFFLQRDLSQTEKTASPILNGVSGPEQIFGPRDSINERTHSQSTDVLEVSGLHEGEEDSAAVDEVIQAVCVAQYAAKASTKQDNSTSERRPQHHFEARVDQLPLVSPPILPYQFEGGRSHSTDVAGGTLSSLSSNAQHGGHRRSASSVNSFGSASFKAPSPAATLFIVCIRVAGLDDLFDSLPPDSAANVVVAVKRIVQTYVTGLARTRRGYISRVLDGGSVFQLLFEDVIYALKFALDIHECMILHPRWPAELGLGGEVTKSNPLSVNATGHIDRDSGQEINKEYTPVEAGLALDPALRESINARFVPASSCPSPYFAEVRVGGQLAFRGPRLQVSIIQTKPTTAPAPLSFQASANTPNNNNSAAPVTSSSVGNVDNYNSGPLRSYLDPVSLRRVYLGDDMFMCSLVAANALPGEILIDPGVASVVEQNAEALGFPETGLAIDVCVPNRDGLRQQVQLFSQARAMRGPYLRPELFQAAHPPVESASSPLMSPKASIRRMGSTPTTTVTTTGKRMLGRAVATPADDGSSLNNTTRSLNLTHRSMRALNSAGMPDDSILSRLLTTVRILRRKVRDGGELANRLETVIAAKDSLLKTIRKDVLKLEFFEFSLPKTVERLCAAAQAGPTASPRLSRESQANRQQSTLRRQGTTTMYTPSELLQMALTSETAYTFAVVSFAGSDALLGKLPSEDLTQMLSLWERIVTMCARDSDGVEVLRRPSGIVRVFCFPTQHGTTALSFWSDLCKALIKADWPGKVDESEEAGLVVMRDLASIGSGVAGGQSRSDRGSDGGISGRFVDMDETVWRGVRPICGISHSIPNVSLNPCSHEFELACGQGLSETVLPDTPLIDQLADLLELCDPGECLLTPEAEEHLLQGKVFAKVPGVSIAPYGPFRRVVLKDFKARNKFRLNFPLTFVPRTTPFTELAEKYRPRSFDPSRHKGAVSSLSAANRVDANIDPTAILNDAASDASENERRADAVPILAASFSKKALSTTISEGGNHSVLLVHVLAPSLLYGENNPFKSLHPQQSALQSSLPASPSEAALGTPRANGDVSPQSGSPHSPGLNAHALSANDPPASSERFLTLDRPSLAIDISTPRPAEPVQNTATAADTVLETALRDALRQFQKCVTNFIGECGGRIIAINDHERPTEWCAVFPVPAQGLSFAVNLHRVLLDCPWSRLLLRQPAFREILRGDRMVMRGVRARVGVHKVETLPTAVHPITGMEVYDSNEFEIACALAHNTHDGETYISEPVFKLLEKLRTQSLEVDLKAFTDNIARMSIVEEGGVGLGLREGMGRPHSIQVYQLFHVDLQSRAALLLLEDQLLSHNAPLSLQKMKTRAQRQSERREQIAKSIEEDAEYLTSVELTMNPIEHPIYKNSHQHGYILSQLAYHKKRATTCEKTLAMLESVNMMSQEDVQHPFTDTMPRNLSAVVSQRLHNRVGFPAHMKLILKELETSSIIKNDKLFDRRYAAELIYGKSGGGTDSNYSGGSDEEEELDATKNSTGTAMSYIRNQQYMESTTTATSIGKRRHSQLFNSSINHNGATDETAMMSSTNRAHPNHHEGVEPVRISRIRQMVQPEDLAQLHIDVDRFTNLLMLHGPSTEMIRAWLDAYPEFVMPDGLPAQRDNIQQHDEAQFLPLAAMESPTTTTSHQPLGSEEAGGGGVGIAQAIAASNAKDLRRLRVLTSMRTPIGMNIDSVSFDKVRHSVIANLSLLLYRLAHPNDPNSDDYNFAENLFAATLEAPQRATTHRGSPAKPHQKPRQKRK